MYIIDTSSFDECFLFHVITGNITFYTNLSLRRGLVQPNVGAFFKTIVLKGVRIYLRYLHNNISTMLMPKVQNKASTTGIFSTNFFLW